MSIIGVSLFLKEDVIYIGIIILKIRKHLIHQLEVRLHKRYSIYTIAGKTQLTSRIISLSNLEGKGIHLLIRLVLCFYHAAPSGTASFQDYVDSAVFAFLF